MNLPRSRGIDRVLHILEHLYREGKPLRPSEIAAGIGAPKSTVYEIVHRLTEARLLEAFDQSGRVFLGRRLHHYGSAYLETFDLGREARPFLAALSEETHETSQLCVLDGNKYAVALVQEGLRHFRIRSDIGARIPLPWTASGRLLLGGLSDEEILRFIPSEDFVLPNGKRLFPDVFLRQVEQARVDGFYGCDSVVDSFTRSLAAPVLAERGRCVATLCLIVPREDDRAWHNSLVATLMNYARQLSSRLDAEPSQPT
jgi:DNA-binding IclR family transcriptional regulator